MGYYMLSLLFLAEFAVISASEGEELHLPSSTDQFVAPVEIDVVAAPNGPPHSACLTDCQTICNKYVNCSGFNIDQRAGGGLSCDFTQGIRLVPQGRMFMEKETNLTYLYKPGFGNIADPPPGMPPNHLCNNPPVVDYCVPANFTVPRRSELWLPGGVIIGGNVTDTIDVLQEWKSSWNTFTVTWSFWNSKWNSKCNDTVWGLCGRAWSPDANITVSAAARLGYRILPMIEVCCVCVMNASYDWRIPMMSLVADAAKYNFDGYILDMECGGYYETQRAGFLTAFENQLKLQRPDKELSWFTHSEWRPYYSFPNQASYVFNMDTYRYPIDSEAGGWLYMYQCQAGIGLEYPGFGTPEQMTAFFEYMATNLTHLRAIGTWGAIPLHESNPMIDAWKAGMARFLATGN